MEQENTPTPQSGFNAEPATRDVVSGDKFGGDKFGGDKIGRDKISATGSATIHIVNYYYREGSESEARHAEISTDHVSVDLPSPYRGLFHFGPDDAALFFGRDAVVESLYEAIQSRPFLPLLGASGSGKSSVVLAGLVPRLQREGHWLFTHFRPGGDPFHALALALVPLYAPQLNATERIAQARQLASFLYTGDVLLPDVLAQIQHNFATDRILLIADQFEELYTFSADDSLRKKFLDALLDGFPGNGSNNLANATHKARLMLTMRADFLGNALSYRPFSDLLQHGDFKLGPMNQTELREVIKKPAAARGVAFESGLVDRILEDVAAEPGVLPLLEFALTELWTRRERLTITHRAYTDIGGVEGALAGHADDSYAALSSSQKEAARRVFLQLVRPGEGTEDIRRVATREELGAAPWELVKQLADARLVVTNRGTEATEETVEVVHEALIRHWGELRGWMASDREFRTWQERLRAALIQWQATHHDEGLLLRGAALVEAEEQLNRRSADLSVAEREFIEASAASIERIRGLERRRRRLTFAYLSGGMAVVTMALLLAWGQLVRAQRQRGEALAVNAQLIAASHPADALLDALAAIGFSRYGQLLPATVALPAAANEALMDGWMRHHERNRFLGHQGEVRSAEHSADGSRIVSAGVDGTVRQWDAKSGRPIGEPLRGHKDLVGWASYSPDGSRIVSAGEDGTVRQWDAKSGRPIGAPLRGHQGSVNVAAYSPDGSRIASAGSDGTVRQWDVKSGRSIGEPLRALQGRLSSAVYSPDGSRIVSSGDDGTVRQWDAKSGRPIGGPLLGHQGFVNRAEYSADGGRIVSAGIDGTIRQWDAESGRPIGAPLRGHQGITVTGAAYSPDGNRIVSAGMDGTVRQWDAKSGRAIGEPLMGHKGGGVWSTTYSPDGSRIVSTGEDGTVRQWNATIGREIDVALRGHNNPVFSVVYSADGKRIVSAGEDGTVRQWDAKSGRAIGEPLRGHKADVNWAAYSPDGSRIVSAGNDGTVRQWESKNGRPVGDPLRGHQAWVYGAAYNRDSSRIVSSGYDGTVRQWDAKSGRPIGAPLRGHQGTVFSATYSPDGSRIVSAGVDGTVRQWDAKSGQAIGGPLRGHKKYNKSVSWAMYSPDGSRIVSSGDDGTVRQWDAKSGRPIAAPLRGHQGTVFSATYSRDGSRIVSAGEDGTVRQWDAKSGRAIGEPLRGHKADVNWAAYSPDGSRIVSAGDDGTVRQWFPGWSDPIRQVCQTLRDHQSLSSPANDVQHEARRTCQRWGWR